MYLIINPIVFKYIFRHMKSVRVSVSLMIVRMIIDSTHEKEMGFNSPMEHGEKPERLDNP